MLNITVTDILSGNFTFGDVHPETCSDVTLRNLKANALMAAMASGETNGVASIYTERDAREANSAVAQLALELVKGLEGDVMENGMALINNATTFASEVVRVGL